jgi:hypothetical protein
MGFNSGLKGLKGIRRVGEFGEDINGEMGRATFFTYN